MLPARNFYITDHQGNIAGVYNTRTDSLEQRTGYYPYGLPHASASENGGPETNRRKFGAKELTADLGLNLYDFAARWHNPALPGFTTPDPLAEKYRDISPYVYCAADPINLIDPSGMKIVFHPSCSEEFKLKYAEAKDFLRGTDAGHNLEKLEQAEDYIITISDASKVENPEDRLRSLFDYSKNMIYWNFSIGIYSNTAYFISPAELLGHEADHALEYNTNPEQTENRKKQEIDGYVNMEEKRVIEGSETKTAQQLGRLDKDGQSRTDHFAHDILYLPSPRQMKIYHLSNITTFNNK